ncbi:MAG: hypothetical protein HYW88_00225 [Candidatus Sungbacteria bacterium]|nr:hypothetical protein [Candidatus Sungbacteria bacterium]
MVAKRLLLSLWNGYPESRVYVTGWIAFDSLFFVDVESKRSFLKSQFGLTDVPIILFAGEGTYSDMVFEELASVMQEIGADAILFPRWHPRSKDDFPDSHARLIALEKYYKNNISLIDTNADTTGEVSSDDCMIAADIVVGMTSTVLVKAALLGKEVISVLYPESGLRLWQENTGLESFPLVELGCAVLADDHRRLREILRNAYRRALGCREAQMKHLPCDGKSAERARDAVLEILKG